MDELALLDQFRPPEGFVTVAGLATTYSADLVACLALLAAMDGVADESLKCTKINALRALERFKDKVRFLANANHIDATDGDPRVMTLFDRLVRVAPFDSRTRAFHPKVVLARQASHGMFDRFVLHVGSRNLTASTSWDLGVTLIGESNARARPIPRSLPGLFLFARNALALVDDTAFLEKMGQLDEISWSYPSDVDTIEFRFHDGGFRSFGETALQSLPGRGEVLLVSPFLNATTLVQAATAFKKAESVKLIAGRADLDRISATNARKVLASEGGIVNAFEIDVAPTDPVAPASEEKEAAGEILVESRGLHAKVFVQKHNERFRMIVGSANLTDHAWQGPNWEAFVLLGGRATVVEPLFEWARTRARVYRPPPINDVPVAKEDSLDAVRGTLSEATVRLEEVPGTIPFVRCDALPSVLVSNPGVTLTVGRFATPGAVVPWEGAITELPACRSHERTSFLRIVARRGTELATWLQAADVIPAIGVERDDEALVRVLGVDYLKFVETLFTGGEAESDESSASPPRQGNGPPSSRLSNFRLEALLMALTREPERLAEVRDVVAKHRQFLAKVTLQPSEQAEIGKFLSAWDAIVEGMVL